MFLVCGLWIGSSGAETIERLETGYHAGRYTVNFAVVLEAPRDRVWDIMNEFEQLPRLSTAITESRVLSRPSKDHHRLQLTYQACVLFLCRTTKLVADVQARPKDELLVIGEPALSDWRHSRERWTLNDEGARSRLRYTAEWEPDFFVPPLIGPWMIKYFLEREIQTTARRVEALAAHE
ncbi:MAG: SRPBCC family protein [Sulfuricaulis sp.]|nr:SRPBCC family protein [Sulfuricaulis sp.]